MATEYGSKRLDIRRPPFFVSVGQIACGMLILLFAILSLSFNYKVVSGLFIRLAPFFSFERFFEGDPLTKAYLLALITFIVFFLPFIVRAGVGGLSNIVQGINEIVRPWMPANIPSAFRSYEEVFRGFKDRALTIYETMDPFISNFFGENSMFLSPSQRPIVSENGEQLRFRFRRLFIAGSLLGISIWFVNWLTTDAAGNLLSELGARNLYLFVADTTKQVLHTPFIWLVILQIVGIVIEYMSILMMIPTRQPSTVALEAIEHYRGFGHPSQLLTRLPDLALPLRWEGFVNRTHTSWSEDPSTSVGDTGSFNGNLIIEQQPQPIEPSSNRGAFLLLGAGWGLNLLGHYLLLFKLLPLPIRQLAEGSAEPFIFAPLFVLVMGIAAWGAANSGIRFINQGRNLLSAASFQSTAILIECIGNLSRADVRVGKSIADSIESSSVVVRSDFTARFWAAEIISEAVRLDGERELLALNQSDESQHWIDIFRREINQLRDEGVKPIAVDLESGDVDDLVAANLRVAALRAAAVEQGKLQITAEAIEPELIPQEARELLQIESEGTADVSEQGELPASVEKQTTSMQEGEWKECPDCAEMVRKRARKCRYCGYRFEEAGETTEA